MEGKRFEFYSDENLIGVLDTVTGKTFNSFEIVDVLNYQDRLIEEQHDEIINWTKKYVGIKKENEHLNRKLQSVTMLKDDYEELIESFEKKYGKNIEDVIDDERSRIEN